jgi:hypothetical protein
MSGTGIVKNLIRRGPYQVTDEYTGLVACGFCGCLPESHAEDCPWVAYRDSVLQVWPEWRADLNDYDMDEWIAKERG